MRPAGNPNRSRGVFDPPSKRRRTHETSPPINPGPSGPPKQIFVDGQIDLTSNDVESISHTPTVADLSDDSLNLGTEKQSSSRIANDGRATQRLKTSHRGAAPSKVVDTDSETEPIDSFPEIKWGRRMMPEEKKGEKVGKIVRDIESRGAGESHPRRLDLRSGPPVPSTKHNQKVRLIFTGEGEHSPNPNPQTGPNNNLLSQSTKFTYGTKGKGKGVHALALTDWVRGTEHLAGLHGHFLGFEFTGGQPSFYVKSDGPQEWRISGNEIQRLEASPRTLGALQSTYTPPTVTRLRVLKRRRSSLNLACVVYDITPLPNPSNQVCAFLTTLSPVANTTKAPMTPAV